MVEHLGTPDGVLISDDTQAIKKGDKSVGIAPQYCGATGQIENCQVLPMLTYASDLGHAFINRRLYLPKCWIENPERLKTEGVPTETVFATKPQLVINMLTEELVAGTQWFTSDSGYGRDPACGPSCTTSRSPM